MKHIVFCVSGRDFFSDFCRDLPATSNNRETNRKSFIIIIYLDYLHPFYIVGFFKIETLRKKTYSQTCHLNR